MGEVRERGSHGDCTSRRGIGGTTLGTTLIHAFMMPNFTRTWDGL